MSLALNQIWRFSIYSDFLWMFGLVMKVIYFQILYHLDNKKNKQTNPLTALYSFM